MGTQKILALKEVRSFHHGCQVYTWVDPVEKGLNLQPGLEKNNRGMNCTAPTTYGDLGAHAAITAVPLMSAHGL